MPTFVAFAGITSINFGSTCSEAFEFQKSFFFFNENVSYLGNTIHVAKKPKTFKKYAGLAVNNKKGSF